MSWLNPRMDEPPRRDGVYVGGYSHHPESPVAAEYVIVQCNVCGGRLMWDGEGVWCEDCEREVSR